VIRIIFDTFYKRSKVMWELYGITLGEDMKRMIEIRSAEGGDDSKLFVKDLATAYKKHAARVG